MLTLCLWGCCINTENGYRTHSLRLHQIVTLCRWGCCINEENRHRTHSLHLHQIVTLCLWGCCVNTENRYRTHSLRLHQIVTLCRWGCSVNTENQYRTHSLCLCMCTLSMVIRCYKLTHMETRIQCQSVKNSQCPVEKSIHTMRLCLRLHQIVTLCLWRGWEWL